MSIITDFPTQDLGSLIEKDSGKLFESVKGISTGYPLLDKLSRGLLPQHLYLLGAETGVGKSIFAINILINIATSTSAKSLYIDLENGSMATGKRFLMIAGGKTSQFFDNEANLPEVSKITATFKDKIFYQDRLNLDPHLKGKTSLDKAKALGTLIEDFVVKFDIKVVIIDPLEEFEAVTNDPSASYTAIQQVVSFFRDLAQKHSIIIILIHHLRKPPADRQKVNSLDENTTPKYRIPDIHDFVGSSKIVNTCTDVWSFVRQIHAVTPSEQGKTLFRILKARETSLGDVRFQMELETLKFSEVSGYQFKQEVDKAEKSKQEMQGNFIEKLKVDYKVQQEKEKLADWNNRAKDSEEDKHE